MRRHRWTSGDLARMRALAAIGYTARDAAELLRLNEDALRHWAKRLGIRFAPARAAIHPAMADFAAIRVRRLMEALR